MSRSKYYIYFFITMFFVFCAAYLTLSSARTTLYSPHCALVLLPIMTVMSNLLIGLLFMPVAFFTWSFPLLKGQIKIPLRTDILSILLIALSALFLIKGWGYGLRHQGMQHTIAMYIFNIIFWLGLLFVKIKNRKHPDFMSNLIFHGTLFIWLAWCSFPWLGESI